MKPKIYLGADHNGVDLKDRLETYLINAGYDVVDDGGYEMNPEDDFPVFASKVAMDMLDSNVDQPMGILICGSGQGMAIAANRFKGIRAVVISDLEQAKLARNDDDSNVLALPAYVLKNDFDKTVKIVEAWLSTPFESIARRQRRNQQLDQIGF